MYKSKINLKRFRLQSRTYFFRQKCICQAQNYIDRISRRSSVTSIKRKFTIYHMCETCKIQITAHPFYTQNFICILTFIQLISQTFHLFHFIFACKFIFITILSNHADLIINFVFYDNTRHPHSRFRILICIILCKSKKNVFRRISHCLSYIPS